jgi:hypothetical protein
MPESTVLLDVPITFEAGVERTHAPTRVPISTPATGQRDRVGAA